MAVRAVRRGGHDVLGRSIRRVAHEADDGEGGADDDDVALLAAHHRLDHSFNRAQRAHVIKVHGLCILLSRRVQEEAGQRAARACDETVDGTIRVGGLGDGRRELRPVRLVCTHVLHADVAWLRRGGKATGLVASGGLLGTEIEDGRLELGLGSREDRDARATREEPRGERLPDAL